MPPSNSDDRARLRRLVKDHLEDPVKLFFFGPAALNSQCPGLEIKDFGKVSFPVAPQQGPALVEFCQTHPSVGIREIGERSNVWKIPASQLTFRNKFWEKGVDLPSQCKSIISKGFSIANGGIRTSAQAFILVGPGGKLEVRNECSSMPPNCFACLLLQLPSDFEDGAVSWHYSGRDFDAPDAKGSEFDVSYIAFLRDLQVSFCPITEGYRSFLLYSVEKLANPNSNTSTHLSRPTLGKYSRFITEVSQILTRPPTSSSSSHFPPINRLVLALNGMYGEEEFATRGFQALKGSDGWIATALRFVDDKLPEGEKLQWYIVNIRQDEDFDFFESSDSYADDSDYEQDNEFVAEEEEDEDWAGRRKKKKEKKQKPQPEIKWFDEHGETPSALHRTLLTSLLPLITDVSNGEIRDIWDLMRDFGRSLSMRNVAHLLVAWPSHRLDDVTLSTISLKESLDFLQELLSSEENHERVLQVLPKVVDKWPRDDYHLQHEEMSVESFSGLIPHVTRTCIKVGDEGTLTRVWRDIIPRMALRRKRDGGMEMAVSSPVLLEGLSRSLPTPGLWGNRLNKPIAFTLEKLISHDTTITVNVLRILHGRHDVVELLLPHIILKLKESYLLGPQWGAVIQVVLEEELVGPVSLVEVVEDRLQALIEQRKKEHCGPGGKPKFSWEMPHEQLQVDANKLGLSAFLRGPLELMSFRGFENRSAAQAFGERHLRCLVDDRYATVDKVGYSFDWMALGVGESSYVRVKKNPKWFEYLCSRFEGENEEMKRLDGFLLKVRQPEERSSEEETPATREDEDPTLRVQRRRRSKRARQESASDAAKACIDNESECSGSPSVKRLRRSGLPKSPSPSLDAHLPLASTAAGDR